MSEDVANHTLALLRRVDGKVDRLEQTIDGAVDGLRGDIRQVLDRMSVTERAMLAFDASSVQKQDQIDHLRHRVDALEDAARH